MKYKLNTTEPFTIEQLPNLPIDVTELQPLDIYIVDFSPIDLTTGYSVGSVIASEDVPSEIFELPEEETMKLDEDGLILFDKSSKYVVGIKPANPDEDDSMTIIYLSELGNRLISNGDGVLMDSSLNICQMYEPREVTPSVSTSGSGISLVRSTTHTLSPYKTYLATTDGVDSLTLKWSKNIDSGVNLKNYTFRGLVYVKSMSASQTGNNLTVNLPSDVTPANTYKYSNGTTYSYVIEWDDTENGFVYTCDAPTITN